MRIVRQRQVSRIDGVDIEVHHDRAGGGFDVPPGRCGSAARIGGHLRGIGVGLVT
jgi:hypothetical protein